MQPLPKNFGKTALGAVHSNYKTEPCKNFFSEGECKFGEGCSFYHTEEERRKLIDPLPNLPEGVTLPPMPEKMKHHHNKGRNGYYNRNQNFEGAGAQQNTQFPQQQTSMIQITNLAELAALSGGFGGFNPNKYMAAPMPMGYQGQNYNFPPHMMYQQQMFQGQMQPMPFNQAAVSGQGQKQFKPQSGKGQRYEKKEKSTSSPSTGTNKSGKKDKAGVQQKYVTKQKKEEKEKDNKSSASKPVEVNAAQ